MVRRFICLFTAAVLVGASPAALAQDDPPASPPLDAPVLASDVFTLSTVLIALALVYGVYHYAQQQRWQRLAFLRQIVQEFEQDADIRAALRILDFEEYRDYTTAAGLSFQVSDELLIQALASHGDRARKKSAIEARPDEDDLEKQYAIETALRDWFNKMLNGLEHFGYLLKSGTVTQKELQPWLLYWVRLIADTAYRRGSVSKFYDQLYNYICNAGFGGVQYLFEQFGYRILPSPFRDDDFVLVNTPQTYTTQLALSLAKASYLIYYDKQYVAEISRRWGVDIRNDFRYFNNRGQDTQAFMFRTDDYMVLAFRGSQEIRDWYTNFSMRLRSFTIRKAGITTLSSYRGKVHTGFFLAWASIEREVLSQVARWQQDCITQGNPLPPLLVTGHSLGGALATMAAAALSENGLDVIGLYTFGQPRVGDWSFARQLTKNLEGRIFRFVNNNDIVPHLPPPFSPLTPLRLYGHLGAIRYFNSRGLLVANYKLLGRAWDSLWGFGKSLFESGFDLISDHSMEYYISYLKEARKTELKDETVELLERQKNRF